MDKEKEKMISECYTCRFKKNVMGNTHIMCTNPDRNMTGNLHGIRKRWFMYPILFDPVWKTKLCSNYEISPVVSGAVSQET